MPMMTCAYCNWIKPWDHEHFPVLYFAECTGCRKLREAMENRPSWLTRVKGRLSRRAAIYQQVASGTVPAYSDVTLQKLGYSAAERARIAADRGG